jgi:hypothetical protein
MKPVSNPVDNLLSIGLTGWRGSTKPNKSGSFKEAIGIGISLFEYGGKKIPVVSKDVMLHVFTKAEKGG